MCKSCCDSIYYFSLYYYCRAKIVWCSKSCCALKKQIYGFFNCWQYFSLSGRVIILLRLIWRNSISCASKYQDLTNFLLTLLANFTVKRIEWIAFGNQFIIVYCNSVFWFALIQYTKYAQYRFLYMYVCMCIQIGFFEKFSCMKTLIWYS